MSETVAGAGRTRGAWVARIWLFAAVYSAALLFANYKTGFHIGLNDFWGNYYAAEQLDASDARTLYDGFFPVGYPLALRLMPGNDPVAASFLLTAASRIAFLGLFGSLMLLLVSGPWALVSMIALALVPRVFQHVLTPTADLPMLVLLTAGCAGLAAGVLNDMKVRRRAVAMIGAGVLLGLAGLFRQHALAAALGFMVGCALVRPRQIGWVFLSGVACTVAYSPQMIVSVLAGHGPLDTAQYINVYKMTHGVELRDVPADLAPDVRAIIAEDPGTFVRAWVGYFLGMLPVLAPALMAAAWPGDVRLRRLGRIVLIAGVPYLAAVAMGWSHRAILPMLPWTVGLAAAMLFRVHAAVAEREAGAGRRLMAIGTAGAVVLGVMGSNANGALVSRYLAEHHRYATVEHLVLRDGVVHPKQVYTTDGSFYLPLTAPHFPYFDGTWLLFSGYRYAERYPRLDKRDLASFHRDCLREGVTHLVLDGNAANVSEALGWLVANPPSSEKFQYLGDMNGYAVFRRN